jgi:hypothetical protein
MKRTQITLGGTRFEKYTEMTRRAQFLGVDSQSKLIHSRAPRPTCVTVRCCRGCCTAG